MIVKKNFFSETWKLTLPFMHTNTLIGLLIENKLQYMIWLQRMEVEPKNNFQVHLFCLYVVSTALEFWDKYLLL